MKLTVLTENFAGGPYLAEHGLSYLIEHNGKKLLFDTGHSDVFLHNAELLGIDLQKEVDTVVLSHGHWDHGDGLQYLQDKTLYAHPLVFMKRYRRLNKTFLGLKMSKSEAIKRFDLKTSITPVEVKPDVFFLGEIPRLNDFEAQQTLFLDASDKPDFILDDSALAIKCGNELIVVTACSHSGVCNIVD
nr:MBL fold metallo-hydrolase [Bacteroidales bacterium]